MADILHDLPIKAPIDRVFDAVSTPEGLDGWWTDRSSGTPGKGEEYVLWFGPEYDWRARVTRIAPPNDFELEMTRADDDWTGTHVGFRLQPRDGATWLQFSHAGWKSPNEHYRVSSNCWAMYLRILRRCLEHGEPSRTMCDSTRKMADALQIFTRLKPGHHSLPARAACTTAAVAMARRAEHDDADRPGVLAVIGRLLASPLRAACV